jgi:hypothetical protein
MGSLEIREGAYELRSQAPGTETNGHGSSREAPGSKLPNEIIAN